MLQPKQKKGYIGCLSERDHWMIKNVANKEGLCLRNRLILVKVVYHEFLVP
jgi:hypothetical protein